MHIHIYINTWVLICMHQFLFYYCVFFQYTDLLHHLRNNFCFYGGVFLWVFFGIFKIYFIYLFILLIWMCQVLVVACEPLVATCMQDLVPRTGIEPRPPALGAWSPNHCATREVPMVFLMVDIFSGILVIPKLDYLCPPC